MSLTLVWQILLAVAAAVFSICGPYVTAWLVTHLKASKNTVLSQQLSTLVNLAGTMALDALQSVASHNVTLTIKNDAVQKAVNALSGPFEVLRVYFNLTPEHVASLVSGELTKLLGVATNENGTVVAAEPTSVPVGPGGTFPVKMAYETDPDAFRDRMRDVRPGFFSRLMSWYRRPRYMLASFAAVAMLLTAGCASLSPATVVTDAQIALTTLSASLSAYEATSGTSTAIITEVQTYITEAQKIITDYQSGVSTSFDVASVTTLVEDGVNALQQVQSVAKATSSEAGSALPDDLMAANAALSKLKADQ